MKLRLIQTLRSLLGILIGLMLISIIAEGIEFFLVALINGAVTTDQEIYFGIRNRPELLGAKVFYNSVAGFAGGYVAAWIAGRASIWHGAFVAAVQLAGFIYGMTASPFASTTPMWAWIALAATMIPAIVSGSWFMRRRTMPSLNSQSEPRNTEENKGG